MKKGYLLFVAAVAVATVSCRQEKMGPEAETAASQGSLETKVVQLSDDYSTSSFQLKFASVPTEEMLSDLLESKGIASVEAGLAWTAGMSLPLRKVPMCTRKSAKRPEWLP